MVIDALLTSEVPDARRDSSIAWELKHQAAVTQFGRLLASKRGIDPEIAAVGALLHDIYTIVSGSYEDHARRGGPVALEMLSHAGRFSDSERAAIEAIVVNHSDKHVVTTDEWIEFGKDVDVLDCFLYPHALDEYLMTKPFEKVFHYLARAKSIWKEFGIPPQLGFSQLDAFRDGKWLDATKPVSRDDVDGLLAMAAERPESPPFAIVNLDGDFWVVYASEGRPPESGRRAAPSGLGPQSSAVALVWPGIGRVQQLTLEEAAARYIVIGGEET